jgi:hypothetical protein
MKKGKLCLHNSGSLISGFFLKYEKEVKQEILK